MDAKTVMSLKKYERGGGFHHELDEGEPIAMHPQPPESLHSDIASRLAKPLGEFAEEFGGKVLVETGFLLARDPDTLRQPDVAYISPERNRDASEEGYMVGAPDLAMEIDFPPESIGDLDRKIEQYLAAGSTLVWVVMPKHERIRIFRADGTSTLLHGGEILDASELFPGWSMPVDQVFA